MYALTLSFLIANLTHLYVLIRHRQSKLPTISERAAQTKTSLAFYNLGHLASGLAFAYFSYQFFWLNIGSQSLFTLAILGVLFEWLQALVPARGKHEKPHRRLAYGMSGLMVLLGIGAIISLPLMPITRTILVVIEAIIICGYPLVRKLPQKYFWTIQVLNINLFYLQMFILLLAI